ncbi:hypothetical protein LTA6_000872 [Microbacterium sp. LTA6]|uniref:CocE/NonD family hydrolase n=1 Tax=unclassified Microbacterium TaxID=2609290 RepID=UPI0031389107
MTPPRGAHPHHCLAEDGTTLRGWRWDPPSIRGVVLIRTPYGAWRHAEAALAWTRRGFRCIIQDVRGRHSSDGSWNPYLTERRDGCATADAVAAENPGLPLVFSGGSYAAHTALEAAHSGHAQALALQVPALGLAETAWDEQGEPQLWHRIGWWHQHARGPRSLPALSAAELADRVERAATIGAQKAAEEWGWPDGTLAGWRRLWSASRLDLRHEYGSVSVPLMLVRGDDDFFFSDAGLLASAWQGPVHVVDGPWGHRLSAGITDETLRARLKAAGGLGGVLDAWLAKNGLVAGDIADAVIDLPDSRRSRSVFDTDLGDWRHERTP